MVVGEKVASIENSLKYESEVEQGRIRLITLGEFVRAYNHSAWLFYCCISKYKVIRKYSKAQQSKWIQSRVNSMLGVLSHYDCWHVRKVLVWEGRLCEFGDVSDDCLRSYPDKLRLQNLKKNEWRYKMRMTKSIVAMMVLTASVGQAGDSAPILLDTVTTSTSPTVNSLDISWNAAWIGGDENATVVIADNGTEVRRAADAGMFSHALTGIWRHDLTYTTYIGGVVQDEVYTTTVYTVQAQFKYDVIDGRAVISDTMQTSGVVSIPSVIDGYPVNEIPNGVFSGLSELTSVTIPDSVTSIGDSAFSGCSGLASVTIPECVPSFSTTAFDGCDKLWTAWYRTLANSSAAGAGVGGGSASMVTTIVQNVEAPYALTNAVADHAIASVTVAADCAIDSFVLKDGKVYDSVLYISNTADHAVTLTLPSGYVYKAIKGARPLEIPANSQSILSITRVANNVFLVSREDLETIQ